MADFTPGPWIENGTSDWFADRYEGTGSAVWSVIRSDSEDRDVAIVMSELRWPKDEARVDHNTAAILAVPEMFAALEAYVAAYDAGTGTIHINDQVRDALARARGETPHA